MTGLRVELLGPPRIEVDGAPLDVDTRKAIALLARLVVGGNERRETLATLLWPASDESRARASLRRTLSALNAGLGHRWLDSDHEEIWLHDEDLWSDVAAFTARYEGDEGHEHDPIVACGVCIDALEEAVALYRGDFLSGFTLRDSPGFDDWCAAEGARLRRAVCGTLDRLIEVRTRRGDLDTAAEHAHRRLELEPLHEPTHRRLMLLHAWRGRRDAAMRQYRTCLAHLEQELGVEPLERTTELHRAIVAGRHPEPPPPAPVRRGSAQPRRRPPQQPLIARDRQVARLRSAYAASERAGHVVAVEGEAGVGKTRLVAELLGDVRAGGARAVAVGCSEVEQAIAYGLAADLLRATAAQDPQRLAEIPQSWLREAARLAPELVAQQPGLERQETLESRESRRRFLEALRQVIAGGLASRRPGLVVIDDVHWADDASQDALIYLLRRLTDLPICVVLIWRTELLAHGHPLRRLITELDAAGYGTHLELERLEQDEIAELADAMGVTLDEERTARLVRESEGLPLFAVAYLRTLAEGSTSDPWTIPADIREVIEERIDQTSDAARQILAAAAVIGRSFDVDTLLEASGRDPQETVDALEELAAADIVTEIDDTPPSYGFRHDKLRTIAYDRTSAARRRLLHRRVADALVQRRDGRQRPPAGFVAHHLRLAGRETEAAHAYAAAADEALALSAHAEALDHLQAALEHEHPEPGPLHARLGELLTLRGDYGQALEAYTAAAAHAHDDRELARLEHRCARVHERRGDLVSSQAHIEAGLAALGPSGDDDLRARLHTNRALLAHRRGEPDLADAEARRALQLGADLGDRAVRAQALNLLGMLARAHGQLDDAVTHLEQSLVVAEELDDLAPRTAALNNLALAHADREEYSLGLELAKRALALCRRLGDRHHEAAILNNLGDLLHRSGRRDESLAYITQAVTIFVEIGEPDRHEPEIWKLTDWVSEGADST